MVAITLKDFRGMSEKVSPKKLPEGMATYAENLDFGHGTLQGIDGVSVVSSTADFGSYTGGTNTIFKTRGGQWLAFNNHVDIVESPIPDDDNERVYFTGNTSYPQVASAQSLSNIYKLGIPTPPAPSITVSPTISDEIETENPISRAYLVTYVTAWGEEGPPSEVSTNNIYDVYSDQQVSIAVGAATGTRNYAYIRIYRTDENGTFRYLGQVPFGGNVASPLLDTYSDAQLGEEVPSVGWVGPDDSMTGLTAMPNGITAGFFDQTLCFSEAYLPHAWPTSYRLTTAYDIVALARMDTGLLVLTKGKPYMVQGSDPSGLVMTELDIAQSCVNKKSVVEMGGTVIYASPDGLVGINPSGTKILTEAVFDKKQWNAHPLNDLKSFRHEDKYVGYMNEAGSTRVGFIFDPRGGMDSFCYIDDSYGLVAVHNDLETDETYGVTTSGSFVEFQSTTAGQKKYEWRSQHLFSPRPINFGVIQIEFGATFQPAGNTTIRLMAGLDDPSTEIYTYTFNQNASFTQTLRLPSGTKYHSYQIQIDGYKEISSITVAESMGELR